MKIKMPNGAILRVRDGVDPQDAANAYMAEWKQRNRENIAKEQESYNPTSGMGALERLAVGATMGVARPIRGALNVLGVDTDKLGASDTDAPLQDTTEGAIGDFVGNTAALTALTAPLGPLAGAAGRALGPLGRAGAALVGPAAQTAAAGAVGGALNAEEGDRLSSAAIGGALGLGTYGLLSGASKLASGGMGKLSSQFEDYRRLYGGKWSPLSHSAEPGWLKTFYNVLSQTAGGKRRIIGQHEDSLEGFRKAAGAIGLPKTLKKTELPDIGSDPQAWAVAVEGKLGKILDPVRSQQINISQNVKRYLLSVEKQIQALPDNELKTKLVNSITKARVGSPSGTISGDELIDLVTGLKEFRNSVGGTRGYRGQEIQKVIDSIKDMTTKFNHPSYTKANAQWKKAWGVLDDWGGWATLKQAINSPATLQGKFTPQVLRRYGARDLGRGEFERLGDLAESAIGDTAGRTTGAWATNLELGAPVGAFLATGNPLLALGMYPAAYGVTNTLAREGVQRALVGDLPTQHALATYLRNNPNAIRNAARPVVAAENWSQ